MFIWELSGKPMIAAECDIAIDAVYTYDAFKVSDTTISVHGY